MIEVVSDFSRLPDCIAVESRRQVSPTVTKMDISSHWREVAVFKTVGNCMRHRKR